MHNGVIVKIRCLNSNKTKTAHSNSENIRYIATRPGVDLSQNDISLDDVSDFSSNESYIKYINERPRSHGLFGNIPTDDLQVIQHYVSDLTEDGQNIYRAIFSLAKEDAQDLGYMEKSKWESTMHRILPDIAAQFNIPIQNLEWVGAFHREEGHPHVHISFWNKNHEIKSPFIHVSKQLKCREIFSNVIFEEERRNLVIEKTAERDLILQSGKDVMQDLENLIPGLMVDEERPVIGSHLSEKTLMPVLDKLNDLITHLPESGRLQYKLLPAEIKKLVDDVTSEILQLPDIKKIMSSYINTTDMIFDTYSVTGNKLENNQKHAFLDIQKRVGNIILKTAKNIKLKDPSCLQEVEEPLRSVENDKLFDSESTINQEDPFLKNVNMDSESENYIPNTNEEINYLQRAEEQLLPDENDNNNFFDSKSIISQEELILDNLNMAPNLEDNTDLEINHLPATDTPSDNYSLGKLYMNPESGAYNISKAIGCFERCLDENHYAAYQLGKIYMNPESEYHDSSKAIGYFESCSKKNSFSLYQLGKIYYEGIGVPKDKNKGNEYLNKSIKLGNQSAKDYFNYRNVVVCKMGFKMVINLLNQVSYYNQRQQQASKDLIATNSKKHRHKLKEKEEEISDT